MSDITITNTRPEHLAALAEHQKICFPTLDPSEWMTVEHFASHLRLFPEGQHVALDGDRVVGYARLCQTGLSHRLEHGLTAVRHSHRRRGLGSALKQAQIKWAADNGYRELTSEMVEGNAPMRALNERLGYRQLPPVIIVGGSAR